MRNKPRIRFKGFTDAWEQRKFLDLLDAQNGIRRGPFGSSLKKDSFVKKSDYVVYEQQNAIYDNYETRYFISKEKYNELIRFNIQPGDFIMSGAGTIGRISMVPDGIKKGIFNQALIRFKVNKDSINPLYFLKFMQSDMMQKQLTQANPGSAMTNLVPMDELKKWEVTIPSLEEQNRISIFINQIDEFITLHQRKLEKLKLAKKALLQKLFPKNGSQFPEIRFKGFTDAWEQRKLGSILIEYTEKNPGNENLPVLTSSRQGLIKQEDHFGSVQRHDISDYNVIPLGFCTYRNRSDDKTFTFNINRIVPRGLVSKFYPVFEIKNGNADFITEYLNNNIEIIKLLAVNAVGTSQVVLSLRTLRNIDVTFPLKAEQVVIGNFIRKLDIYITLHQRKLDKLQEVKKGLLQKMFV